MRALGLGVPCRVRSTRSCTHISNAGSHVSFIGNILSAPEETQDKRKPKQHPTKTKIKDKLEGDWGLFTSFTPPTLPTLTLLLGLHKSLKNPCARSRQNPKEAQALNPKPSTPNRFLKP